MLGAACAEVVHLTRLDELRLDPPYRVERTQRILEHDADVPTAHMAQLRLVGDVQRAAVEGDRAAADARVLRQQAQDRQGDGGFATARLTNDCTHLATADLQIEPGDELRLARRGGRLDPQVVDVEEHVVRDLAGLVHSGVGGRAHRSADRGSRRSRTCSPMMLSDRTSNVMVIPGISTSQ